MFCTECGYKVEDDARFCPECGALLGENAGEESSGFCIGCGRPLDADGGFCSQCGQPVGEDVLEEERSREAMAVPLAKPAAGSVPQMAAEDAVDAPRRVASSPEAQSPVRSKLPVIIGAAIAVIAVVACIIIVVLMRPPQAPMGADASASVEIEPPAEASPPVDGIVNIALPNTLVTDYEQVNRVSFPAFAIDYPDGWKVEDHYTAPSAEMFTLSPGDDSDVAVEYDSQGSLTDLRYPPEVVAVEKVADSSFEPAQVQASDYRALNPMMVARVDCDWPDQSGAVSRMSCYAVLPQRALSDFSAIDLVGWRPGFTYGYAMAVCSEIPDEGFSETQMREVVAILASFREISYEDAKAYFAESGAQDDLLEADYVLPDSATRLLSSAELQDMSDYELFVARNEIFARHGRTFQKQELKDHFGSKSWYHGTVSPEAFSDATLSDVERKNIETIKAIEQSRNSQYLLP